MRIERRPARRDLLGFERLQLIALGSGQTEPECFIPLPRTPVLNETCQVKGPCAVDETLVIDRTTDVALRRTKQLQVRQCKFVLSMSLVLLLLSSFNVVS